MDTSKPRDAPLSSPASFFFFAYHPGFYTSTGAAAKKTARVTFGFLIPGYMSHDRDPVIAQPRSGGPSTRAKGATLRGIAPTGAL